jgi:hypothetical protein
MSSPPFGSVQLNQVFRGYEESSGYVDVHAASGYYCFGSVVDNHSGATKIIPPQ